MEEGGKVLPSGLQWRRTGDSEAAPPGTCESLLLWTLLTTEPQGVIG